MGSRGEIIVLIDYDNYFKKPISDYSISEFEFELITILNSVVKNVFIEKYYVLTIRLYSGWLENSIYTKTASQVIQKLAGVNIFPITLSDKLIINGRIEIATTLFDIPEYIFENTYKERKGVPRIRINEEIMKETCISNKDYCPGYILSNFTKKKNKLCNVEGCSNHHNELFFLREQKMVDTIIACDLITYCENDSIDAIFLVSDDSDHIPALITGSYRNKNKKNIYINIKNSWSESFFKNILNDFNIKTILLS